MASSSPSRMQGSGFFKHVATPKKEVYYEDLYGSPNEDEVFDRFPDACASEVESGEEDSEQFSKSGDYKRFFDGSYTGSSVRAPKTVQPSSATTGPQDTTEAEKRYKITPTENSSQSVELPPSETHGMFKEVNSGRDTEEKRVSDSFPSVAIDHRRSSRISSRMPRPVSRRLFKHQLAEQDKKRQKENAERKQEEKREMAEARRKEKVAVRRANMSKEPAKSKHTTNKKAKLTEDLGGDDDRSEYVKAYVVIDLTGIDVGEYERYSDRVSIEALGSQPTTT